MHNKQASWSPFQKKCTVAPFLLHFHCDCPCRMKEKGADLDGGPDCALGQKWDINIEELCSYSQRNA